MKCFIGYNILCLIYGFARIFCLIILENYMENKFYYIIWLEIGIMLAISSMKKQNIKNQEKELV